MRAEGRNGDRGGGPAMSGDGMEHGTGRSARHSIGRVLVLVLGVALAGCSSTNPIEWYRSAMGISANDPSPDAPNAAALEAGADKPYPNLAAVPSPPTRALSTAERESLTQQLIADRANARYIDEQLRAGPGPAVSPPGAAPPPPPLGQRAEAARTPPEPAPAAKPPLAQAAPARTPAQAAASPPPPAAPPPSRSSLVSLNAPDPSQSSAAAPAGPTPAAAPPPLVSPSVRSVPEPETPRAPPPPPSLAGARPPAGQPSPAASIASPPRIAARPPVAATAPGAALGQVSFAPNSARLSPTDRPAVEAAAQAQRQSG